MRSKILVICTGNTCRSQMAEAIIQNIDSEFKVFSAGTKAETKINPFAVKAIKEIGLDISSNVPKNVSIFLNEDFDYVFTVCDGAKEICPVFIGNVKHRMHIGFADPANATGSEEEIMAVYRKVRDEIKFEFEKYFKEIEQAD